MLIKDQGPEQPCCMGRYRGGPGACCIGIALEHAVQNVCIFNIRMGIDAAERKPKK
jgi:hypothetical protein